MKDSKKYWQLPDWEAVSYKRPSDFNPYDYENRNDYQDILSTWEAVLEAFTKQDKRHRQ